MAKVLREYRMTFEKMRKVRKAVPHWERLGLRSKLGGKPDWAQGDESPRCRKCRKAMTFVAQIDSMEMESRDNPHSKVTFSDQQHFMFEDAGMIYVFFCFRCGETQSIVQGG